MKGSLHSDELLHAVADRENGLRTERRLSHVFAMSVPSYHKPLFVTDAAVNIFPGLEDKADICRNAIQMLHSSASTNPRWRCCRRWKPSPPSCLQPWRPPHWWSCPGADRSTARCSTGHWPSTMRSTPKPRGSGYPLRSRRRPGHPAGTGHGSGQHPRQAADLSSRAEAAGIVLGARVPIVFTSRADSPRARIASCGLAVLLAEARRARLGIPV